MLHITNGTSVSLPQTGLPGDFVYWVDILHDGPVPAGLALEDLSRVRARFISDFFDIPHAEASFEARDEALLAFGEHEEIVLWFEHDLYDQLQLIQILDFLAAQDRGRTAVSLICSDKYLGPLQPAQLADLFETRHPVTPAEFETATAAWTAFCAPEPASLVDFLRHDTSALPFLGAALRRHLQQFPSRRNGLARSELQILSLVESGPHDFRSLFRANQDLEDWIYLGDTTFRRYVGTLAEARSPLLATESNRYVLTDAGREVLHARQDHVRLNGINRWLGGVHLCEGAPIWRWDEQGSRIYP
jgi:hypothetical protein